MKREYSAPVVSAINENSIEGVFAAGLCAYPNGTLNEMSGVTVKATLQCDNRGISWISRIFNNLGIGSFADEEWSFEDGDNSED